MSRRDEGPEGGRDDAVGVDRTPLGRCPRCLAEIPTAWLLIEYESAGGRSRFAECPECHEVVRPREAT